MIVFILEDALSVWKNLGKHLLFVWLFVSSIKTGTRRIIRLDELSSVIRLERRTTENSLSRRTMRLVPVFILETNNQTSNKCLPKFVQTDNASSSIKTANKCSARKKMRQQNEQTEAALGALRTVLVPWAGLFGKPINTKLRFKWTKHSFLLNKNVFRLFF